MAKKSVVERNKKRILMNEQYYEKRKELKDKILEGRKDRKNSTILTKDLVSLSAQLAGLPRNSSSTRICNRCFVTGRKRGYYRYFGVSRLILRKWASEGVFPGVFKKSL